MSHRVSCVLNVRLFWISIKDYVLESPESPRFLAPFERYGDRKLDRNWFENERQLFPPFFLKIFLFSSVFPSSYGDRRSLHRPCPPRSPHGGVYLGVLRARSGDGLR